VLPGSRVIHHIPSRSIPSVVRQVPLPLCSIEPCDLLCYPLRYSLQGHQLQVSGQSLDWIGD